MLQTVAASSSAKSYTTAKPAAGRALNPQAPQSEVLYEQFLKGEAGATTDHLAYQDRGVDLSPYKGEIASFPSRLQSLTPPASQIPAPIYPGIGAMPAIDESKLDFLNPDITNACVCVGSWQQGALHANWYGRQATDPVQMWSSTKTFPMVRTVVKSNQAAPAALLEECLVKDPQGSRAISVPQAFDDIVSYRAGDEMSNSLARMFKQFDTPDQLEGWLHGVTGNQRSIFRGGYGANAYIREPELVDAGKVILKSAGSAHSGDNLVSAYDLSRMLSLVGWHSHLPTESQLPHATQAGVDTLVRGLGTDSARFADVALEKLGLKDRVQDPVFISKLGFGFSDTRHKFEQVYSAYLQFTDKETDRSYEIALALRGAKPPASKTAAMELDARMATEVTLILQKVMTGELV